MTLRVKKIVGERVALLGRTDLEFDVAFCPEFLKEGTAVEDFMKPDRIVIGTENNRTAELLKELLKTPLIFDGRNQYAPAAIKPMGFEYVCVGRG